MRFILIQLFIIVFYQKVFASIYNTPCTTSCNLSGLICENGRCKCDSKNRLFWTGVRCLSCPTSWAMSETKCIGYYGTKMTWSNAALTCRDMQGDLISLRDDSILPLIYQVTANSHRRKKREIAADKTVVWTSARAIQVTNLGLYQWSDKSLGKFDSTHRWWCRMGISGLSFHYPYNEPTGQKYKNDVEECVLFRRGTTLSPMLCLDDEFCYHEYPFICERSESTAQIFIGPAPWDTENKPSSSGNTKPTTRTAATAATTSSYARKTGGYTQVTQSHINNDPFVPGSVDAHASNSKKDRKSLMIIIAVCLLLLAGIMTGIMYFIKRRNASRTHPQINVNKIQQNRVPDVVKPPIQTPPPVVKPPIKIAPPVNNITDVNDVPSPRKSASETGLTLDTSGYPGNIDFNIGKQKQQKNKRGGYTKQQFDEFE